ncbi:hypothetical protein NMG60_11025699 [Bertholletia excelsa]
MARKRKAGGLPRKARVEEPQKRKLIEKQVPSSSEEEEVDEIEEEVEEEESVEDSESEPEEEEEEEDSEEEEEEEEDEQGEEEEEEEEESEEEGEESDDSKRETLRKLLEPFGKDQIIDFLKEAALKDPQIFSRIIESAESDPTHRKIFVHGLGWDATTNQVLSVFKQYGDIEECKVVTDKLTGRAKGYAFVLFKTRQGAKKALKQPQKKIGSRMTSCQLASAGAVPDSSAAATGRKIYVANVGPQVNPDKLRAFFAKYGEIEEGPLGRDPISGKLRGFAIFVYKTTEGSKKALEEPIKMFEGCQLQCRRATEGRKNQSQPAVFGASGAAPNVMQQSGDTSTLNNYGLGVNPAAIAHSVNPAAVLLGPSPGIGLVNPLASAIPSVATGLIPSMGTGGLSGNYGGGGGINSISPSVIGSYGSQAALQGLGAYNQTAYLGVGHSSSAVAPTAPAAAAERSQAAFGPSGGNTYHSSYLGH